MQTVEILSVKTIHIFLRFSMKHVVAVDTNMRPYVNKQKHPFKLKATSQQKVERVDQRASQLFRPQDE